MKLSDIYLQFDSLEIFDSRYLMEDYLELVFFTKNIEKWDNLLTEILGPAVKPFDAEPSCPRWLCFSGY